MDHFGGIEAGGTKFVCAIGTDEGKILAEQTFSTTTPAETLDQVGAFFQTQKDAHPLTAIGIGSFGPLDLHPESLTYGHITSTPKADWVGTDLAGGLERRVGLPVTIDTDVNAAALGEGYWGAAVGLKTFLYLTIGTGIGGGAMVEGELLHGLLHPEMGHFRLPRDREEDPFDGVCRFHGDCFEGLASGPALEARWGQSPEELAGDHPAWGMEAKYIGDALTIYIGVLSPERIILGGGVMHQRELFPLIRNRVLENLAGYIQTPAILEGMETYIVPPGLGDRSGVLGAIALASRAMR